MNKNYVFYSIGIFFSADLEHFRNTNWMNKTYRMSKRNVNGTTTTTTTTVLITAKRVVFFWVLEKLFLCGWVWILFDFVLV